VQAEFARHEHLGQRHWRDRQPRTEGGKESLDGVAKVGASGDLREAQQVQSSDGIAGGLGAVVVFLNAEDEAAVAGGSAKEPTVLRIFEKFALFVGEPDGQFEVTAIELGLV